MIRRGERWRVRSGKKNHNVDAQKTQKGCCERHDTTSSSSISVEKITTAYTCTYATGANQRSYHGERVR